MEAPEKIYLQDSMSTDTIGELWPEWFDAKVSDNSIEYTRTDVFIEKACEWIKENIMKYTSIENCEDEEGIEFVVHKKELIENFKEAMINYFENN